MSYSFSTTFTRTHAREIASRVAADLRLMRSFYGSPSLEEIDEYEQEFVELLIGGYLRQLEYGFKRDGVRVVSLRYTIVPGSGEPQRAGAVFARADISGASFFSFLTYSDKFLRLSPAERSAIEDDLPVLRTPGSQPTNGSGYWTADKSYASGGVAASRETFRPAA